MSRLLLISCSATKRPNTPGVFGMAAIDRYDGPKYRVVRKALAEGGREPPTIRILSAALGLIGPDEPIADYNLELTPKSRDVLAACRYRRGDIAAQVAQADDVFVMAGGHYTQVLQAWCPSASRSWIYATGAPGQRLQMLAAWLRTSHEINEAEQLADIEADAEFFSKRSR